MAVEAMEKGSRQNGNAGENYKAALSD